MRDADGGKKTLVAGLVLLILVALPSVAQNTKTPNILVIIADDAGYADFGFQGSREIQTPHLDTLAREGVVFTDAHVTASVCSPSRAGLMTGRYQQRFGHEANVPPPEYGMDTTETTLAQALRQQSYATGMFGKWHLGTAPRYHPNRRGFDEFYGLLGGSRSYFPFPESTSVSKGRAIMHNRERVGLEKYITDALGTRTAEFVRAHSDESFFAYLSFTAPHGPMEARAEDLKRFQGHPRQTYAAMMWAMDRAVGHVLEVLKEEGIAENTAVFFLSDNGGAHFNQSSNYPLKGAKGNVFEGGLRVPFVLRWPKQLEGGRAYGGLTSALDIFATAYAIAGGEEDPGKPLDGTNLMPHLTERTPGPPHDRLFWRKEDHAAARIGAWKLIRLDDYGSVFYNLTNDLGEVVDLKEEYPASFQRAKRQLQSWEENLEAPHWHESEAWREVTWGIHEDLMENRVPDRLGP